MAKIKINVAGVTAVEANSGFQKVATGPYMAAIVSIGDPKPSSKGDGTFSYAFKVTHVDGQFKGASHNIYLSDNYAAEFNKQKMRGLMEGLGVAAGQLDKGEFEFDTEKMIKKIVPIYVKAPADGELGKDGKPAWPDVKFISKAEYKKLTDEQKAAGKKEVKKVEEVKKTTAAATDELAEALGGEGEEEINFG